MPDDSLERLSKKLDSGKEADTQRRSPLFPKAPEAPRGWEEKPPEPEPIAPMVSTKRRFTPFTLLFLGSLAFFVVAAGVSAFLFFSGSNIVSTRNVDVQVSGPAAIGAGDTLSLQVVITNRNTVPMQLTDLVIEFPPGTRSDTNIAVALPRIRESLGTINPGESVSKTIKAVLFGQTGDQVPVQVSAEYRVPSSNAIFTSATSYTARISQAPATISVNSLSQVVSGQSASFTVSLTSNSPQVLKDMLLVVSYPPGFTFSSSNPGAISGSSVWSLGDIEPGGTRTVTIQGAFAGEDGDMRVINFTAGNRSSPGGAAVSAPLATLATSLTVTKPFVSAVISLNGTVADTHTIARGQSVSGQIQWTNNLPVAVQNLEIQASLTGAILDRGSVSTQQGFYSSSKSSIIWDKTTSDTLANIAPGQSGTLTFSFATLPPTQSGFRNPEVDLAVTVHASRQSEGNVPETITSTAATKALVSTNLALAAGLSHSGSDTGPVPPKADTETTYTVTWSVTNSVNALANTAVTATLPGYVRYIGSVTPGSERVVFNGVQKVLTWNIGDLAENQSRTVSFQVGVTPSVSQISQAPAVVTAQRVSGFDRFAQDTVEGTADEITTRSSAASPADGTVVP